MAAEGQLSLVQAWVQGGDKLGRSPVGLAPSQGELGQIPTMDQPPAERLFTLVPAPKSLQATLLSLPTTSQRL